MTAKSRARGTNGFVNVKFDLPAAVQAEEIALCGDFNHWSQTETKLSRDRHRVWRVTIPLQAGRSYRYRYLLDGTYWENDWSADGYVRNPYGSEDSVVNVPIDDAGRIVHPEARETTSAMRPQPKLPTAPNPIRNRTDMDHQQTPGVQGANVGYWQAVGSTRAGAKRSKRP